METLWFGLVAVALVAYVVLDGFDLGAGIIHLGVARTDEESKVVLVALGPRWTTRILTVPGEQLVARGPYRFMSHPNYCVVIGEILVLPLAFGLVWYAIIFSILNLAILWVRIRAEDRALGQ
jgi:isoprenylcysteine carboxyl methyltransferase (ICMT) family protein YpbQ